MEISVLRGSVARKSEGPSDGFGGRSRGPPAKGSKVTKAHQCLSGEHLQQGDEVVSISEVLVQVRDVPLGLWGEDGRHTLTTGC